MAASLLREFRVGQRVRIPLKSATDSGGKLPPVGAKRRGCLHCYSEEAVGVNFARRFRMDSPFKLIR